MPLSDTDIKAATRHFFHHDIERTTCGHGRSNTNNFLVLLSQLKQSVPENILKTGRFSLLTRLKTFTRLNIKKSRCMPLRGNLFSRRKALTLSGVYVQHLRATHILYGTQCMHEADHIVSVHGAEIANIHPLKDVLLLSKQTLYTIIEANETLSPTILHQSKFAQYSSKAIAPLVVARRNGKAKQIFLETAHRTIDRHFVVIEHNEHIIITLRHIIKSLKSKSSTHCAIANNSYHTAFILTKLLGSHSHSQGGRYRIGSMATGKAIIFALFR